MAPACDSCSVRKIKCNGSPCEACRQTGLRCSDMRKRKKPGPRGPRKRTKEAIHQLQLQTSLNGICPNNTKPPEGSLNGRTIGPCSSQLLPGTFDQQAGRIPISILTCYLDIYQSHLHVVWPVLDCEAFKIRLQDIHDRHGYALASAICSATIAQLHLPVHESIHSHYSMAVEAENTRALIDYAKHLEITDALLTCFFLHVFYSNTGKSTKSTILLREAIAYAHILGIHQDSFYAALDPDTTQHHLRIAWLLFITDTAHSLQHDLPPTFKLSPSLPEAQPRDSTGLGSAFSSLCRLFQGFDSARPPGRSEGSHPVLLGPISSQLRRTHPIPLCNSEVQLADIVVTDSWLRIVLWKAAIPYLDPTTDPKDQGLSVLFPMSVARNLLSKLTALSSYALETHGPGMMSKLFEVASSVADVIICAPDLADLGCIEAGPRDILRALSGLISSLRTIGDPALLTLLEEKIMTCALNQVGLGRLMPILDVTDDDARNLIVSNQEPNS